MKKKFVCLIATIPLLLSSCGSADSIKGVYNYDLNVVDIQDENINPFVEVGPDEIIEMFEAELSFALFIHDVNCSHCIVANANFREVFEEYPFTIYRYTYAGSTYEQLNEYNETLFPNMFYTPRFLIIQDGWLSVDVNSSRLASTPSRLRGSLKAFIKDSNMYRLSLDDAFTQFNKDHSSYILFTYSAKEYGLYNYMYQSVKKYKTPTLFINVDESEEILDNTLIEKGLDLTSPVLSYIENSEINYSVNQLDESKIDEFLKDFK